LYLVSEKKSVIRSNWILRRSAAALARALELEPDNARAVAISAVRKLQKLEYQAAATGMERALALDPADPEVLRYSSITAAVIGRFDVAVSLAEYATERDPLCSLCIFALGRAYIRAGQLDQAESSVRTYVATGRGGWHTLGITLLLKGEPQRALESFRMIDVQDQPHLAPFRLQGEALALHALGSPAESAAALEALESEWGEKLPHLPAEVYAWTGRADPAFEWLATIGKPDWIDPFSPLLQPLREDSRWVPYWRQFGQSPVELAAIRFDPVLPAG
jgi:tetratricopeptide (TPR) repeat protein